MTEMELWELADKVIVDNDLHPRMISEIFKTSRPTAYRLISGQKQSRDNGLRLRIVEKYMGVRLVEVVSRTYEEVKE